METACTSLLLALIAFLLLCCNSDGAARIDQSTPNEIVGKALACFRNVYACPPQCRLGPSGLINVNPDQTDEYCNGGCFQETGVMLTCVDQILSNFVFYNKATIADVRRTIIEACSNTDKRGDFNVAERMATSHARSLLPSNLATAIILFMAGYGFLWMIF